MDAGGIGTIRAVTINSNYKTASLKKKKNAKVKHPTIVLTIGHSTRAIEEFIDLLQAHAVSRVVDVRTIPRSVREPTPRARNQLMASSAKYVQRDEDLALFCI